MALPKFTIYKHVKLEYGWRYCKAAFHSNSKIKPDIVIVHGVEETHREGAYYLNHNQTWIPVGEDAKEASKERLKRLNSAEYHGLNGTTPPEARSRKTPMGVPLSSGSMRVNTEPWLMPRFYDQAALDRDRRSLGCVSAITSDAYFVCDHCSNRILWMTV